jgi:RNA-directed DNA polymerase
MSLHDTEKPIGGVHMQRVMESPGPDNHLLERMLSRANMQQAWKRVKANQGAPGVDDMAIDQFPAFARNKWPEIRQSLLAGTYQPKPVKRVEIAKPTGGTRPLGIPTVLDRLIQQAITQVLVPVFDPGFSDHSYGFRPGRSAHDAVRKVQDYIKEGYRFAVDPYLQAPGQFSHTYSKIPYAPIAQYISCLYVFALLTRCPKTRCLYFHHITDL